MVVEVNAPLQDTLLAMALIDKFLVKNNISIKLSITYDFETDSCGMYLPDEKGQGYRIFVNPDNCKKMEEINKQYEWDEPFCPGYAADLTLFGVTIHEFAHLLQYRVFTTIIEDYKRYFPTKRFYLNEYCNNELHDELAEIMTLYFINPFLLKLISKEHYDFCKIYFKSPVACTLKKCFEFYNSYPIIVKEHMKTHWGFVYDVDKQNFIRIDNGKTKEDTTKFRKKY